MTLLRDMTASQQTLYKSPDVCQSHIKPSFLLKVTHRSFRHASPYLWNQLPTSLRIPHLNYSSPSQRRSLEHAVQFNLLHTADTYHHFSLCHS